MDNWSHQIGYSDAWQSFKKSEGKKTRDSDSAAKGKGRKSKFHTEAKIQ